MDTELAWTPVLIPLGIFAYGLIVAFSHSATQADHRHAAATDAGDGRVQSLQASGACQILILGFIVAIIVFTAMFYIMIVYGVGEGPLWETY